MQLTEQNTLRLRPRLAALAEHMAQIGRAPADIGTDHGFVPAYLLLSGAADRAIAADIAEGPLARADKTVQRYHLSDRMTLLLTDGLHGIDVYAPDSVLIAGMGGETISEILSASDYPQKSRCPMLLQPMTKASYLRLWLSENGYRMEREHLVRESHRIYQMLQVRWDGVSRPCTPAAAEVGEPFLHTDRCLFAELLRQQIIHRQKECLGLSASVNPLSEEKSAIDALLSVLRTWYYEETEKSYDD